MQRQAGKLAPPHTSKASQAGGGRRGHAGRQAGRAGRPAGRQAGRQADPGRQYQTGRDSDNIPARTAVPPSVQGESVDCVDKKLEIS